jgi:hypothetical protein
MAIECRHCNGTGTCSNGDSGNSCASCAAKAAASPLPFTKNKIVSTKGLPCGTCLGYGDVERRVWHLQSSVAPVLGLSIILIVLLIVVVIAMASPTLHAQILTLLGTLAGSVVGFYFRGQYRSPAVPQTRPPRLKSSDSPDL